MRLFLLVFCIAHSATAKETFAYLDLQVAIRGTELFYEAQVNYLDNPHYYALTLEILNGQK